MDEQGVSRWCWMDPLVAVAVVIIIGAVFTCYVKCNGGQQNPDPQRESASAELT